MKNNKIIQWFIKHSLTIASCVLIATLGIVFLVWSSPGPTIIGEDISTSNITASGDVTVSGSLGAKTGRTATLVVAANDSATTSKAQADYVCDGTDDHVQIQDALDALPATGGEVLLLDGTFNIEESIVLDSYQTLRGCGRNTILTTTTARLYFITATGSDGSEKVGIFIADLCIDGAAIAETGIFWTYVDSSKIWGIWVKDIPVWTGIWLETCDLNEIIGNTFRDSYNAIYLGGSSSNNIVSGNTSQGHIMGAGIEVYASYGNVISGNVSLGDGVGIEVTGNGARNIISGNVCQWNSYQGIYISADDNIISGNICVGNSQEEDNLRANIEINAGSRNLIEGNLCRAPTIGTTLTAGEPIGETEIAVTDTAGFEVGMGVVIDPLGGNWEYHRIVAITAGAPGVITIDAGLTNAQGVGETIDVPEAQYGIRISVASSEKNIVQGNDLYDSGKTANFNDAGTLTTVNSDNRGIEITQVKDYAYVKNTSGGALAAGDVVTLKSVAAGNEITTTTAQGDDKVFGMVAETIANTASGLVQVLGKTTALKVDGTTDIAIGDLLGTFTTAGITQKAAAGDMAFAVALEAYTTDDSNGVIDALLITPRKL